MNAISIKNLYVSYKNNLVLKNISTDLKEGSFISILGPNGAGKTTLLSVILGVKKIDSGKVKIFEEEINSKNILKWRKEIGYLPQNIFIDSKFPINVYETVLTGRLGLRFLKGIRKEDKEIAEWAMERVGIIGLKKRPIGALSGGELKKVFIARALCQNPKILLLDEPTSHLDLSSSKNILNLIEKLYHENRITTIFVTHLISQIPESCNESIFIKDGSLIFQGRLEEGLKNFPEILRGENDGIS